MASPGTCGWTMQRNCAQISRWHECVSLMARQTWHSKCWGCTIRLFFFDGIDRRCYVNTSTPDQVNNLLIQFCVVTGKRVWRWLRWCLALLWLREPALMRPTWIWLLQSSSGWKTCPNRLTLTCWGRPTSRGTHRALLNRKHPQRTPPWIKVGKLCQHNLTNCFRTGHRKLLLKTYQNRKNSGRMYTRNSVMFVSRGAEVQRSPAVAGILTGAPIRGAELCRTASNCRGPHCRGNEGSRGETHRFPLFSRDIAQ